MFSLMSTLRQDAEQTFRKVRPVGFYRAAKNYQGNAPLDKLVFNAHTGRKPVLGALLPIFDDRPEGAYWIPLSLHPAGADGIWIELVRPNTLPLMMVDAEIVFRAVPSHPDEPVRVWQYLSWKRLAKLKMPLPQADWMFGRLVSARRYQQDLTPPRN